jgi:hypothetical protein
LGQADSARPDAARRRVKDAETRLRRLQEAIEAGPAALVDAINRVHEDRDVARKSWRGCPPV